MVIFVQFVRNPIEAGSPVMIRLRSAYELDLFGLTIPLTISQVSNPEAGVMAVLVSIKELLKRSLLKCSAL